MSNDSCRIVTVAEVVLDVIKSTVFRVNLSSAIDISKSPTVQEKRLSEGLEVLFDIPSECRDLLVAIEARRIYEFPISKEGIALVKQRIEEHKDDLLKRTPNSISSVLQLNYMCIFRYPELLTPQCRAGNVKTEKMEPLVALFRFLFQIASSVEELQTYTEEEKLLLTKYYQHLRRRFFLASRFLLRMQHLLQIQPDSKPLVSHFDPMSFLHTLSCVGFEGDLKKDTVIAAE